MPDRIEAGTYALSVMGCSGRIILENMSNDVCDHLIKIFTPLKCLSLKKEKNGSVLEVKKQKVNLYLLKYRLKNIQVFQLTCKHN